MRAVRILAEQEHAVRVVHVGRVGIAPDQFLERRARRAREPRRLVVRAAPRQQHHLAPIRRQLRRQHRHPQRRQAERLDDRRRVVALLRERLQVQHRELVLLEPRHDDRRVVAHGRQQLVAVHAQVARLQQVGKRDLVVLHLELAQALHAVDAAVAHRLACGLLLLGRDDPAERVARLGVAIHPVVQRADVPVALVPGRPQLHRLVVQPERLVDPAGLAGHRGLAGEAVELGAGGRPGRAARGGLGRRGTRRRRRSGSAPRQAVGRQAHAQQPKRDDRLRNRPHGLSDDGGARHGRLRVPPAGGLACRSWRSARRRSAMAL